jgi:ribosome biogenesis GTPase
MQGTVYKSTGSWYIVKDDRGQIYECRIKGKFRIKGIKSTNPVAVGDVVYFDVEQLGDEKVGIIKAIEDRRNYIIRKSVNLAKQTHIIAANIDLVLLMVTIKKPRTFTGFVDRFLATSEAYEIPVVLLFNKADIYEESEMREVDELSALYSEIGYTCVTISAKTGRNVEEVKDLMRGKTSMFSGNSGVGKSTLINLIEPALKLKTAQVSEQHLQGQHTTTFAEMYDLDWGARIIDTPGIKGFGLVDMDKDEIGDYFPEFFALKGGCKFHNCLHLDEPHCAVKEALEQGELAWSRYKSYVGMISGEEDTYRMENYEGL